MTKTQKALYDRAYRVANKERLKQQQAAIYLANRLARIARANAWGKANPKRRTEIKLAYKKTEKGRLTEKRYKRARRAAHRLARPAWRNQFIIDALYEQAERDGLHIDHIVPLCHPLVCGLHVETNLRPLDPIENHKKGNRWWPDCPDHLYLDGARA